MIIKIELDESQVAKYNAWRKEVDSRAVQIQKEKMGPTTDPIILSCWEGGYPYGGAIGGDETWSICHTSIGSVIKVKEAYTNSELDLTDYDAW